jgi:hypothetical protein
MLSPGPTSHRNGPAPRPPLRVAIAPSVGREPRFGRRDRGAKQLEFWKTQNGRQSGDPAKLARALITISSQEPPPRRFIAGADAMATAEKKVADLKAEVDAERGLSTSLSFD